MVSRCAALVGLFCCVLLAAPGPACGTTRCDTPVQRWDTAAGLEQAKEKFLACALPEHSSQPRERWKAPEMHPTLRSAGTGASRIKRPSDVGSIINRCRTTDAIRSTPQSSSISARSVWSANGKTDGPSWSAMRDADTPSYLRAEQMNPQQQQQQQQKQKQQQQKDSSFDDSDAMLESPMLLSSTKTNSPQTTSVDLQATPVCTSQMRPSSFGTLGQSEFKSAGADTPHLRASDWPDNAPEAAIQRGPLSQKLFAHEDQQTSRAEPTVAGTLLSAIKAAQEQQHQQLSGVNTEWSESHYEEEACMLLSNARTELQALNQRWKEAEEAHQQHRRQAAGLRIEIEILQDKVDILEAEKVSIYTELTAAQEDNSGLRDGMLAAQQHQRETAQRCSAIMAEKAAAEARLAAVERDALQQVIPRAVC